jgi:hypothetical protein
MHPSTNYAKLMHPSTNYAKLMHPSTNYAKLMHPSTKYAKLMHPSTNYAKLMHPSTNYAKLIHPSLQRFTPMLSIRRCPFGRVVSDWKEGLVYCALVIPRFAASNSCGSYGCLP